MTPSETFLRSWLSHRVVTQEVLKLVGEDAVDFRPWDDAMTLGQLVRHMADSALMFARVVNEGVFTRSSDDAAPAKTLADLRADFDAKTEQTKTILAGLDKARLDAVVDTTQVFGAKLSGDTLLQMMRDHEIHHKGQLFVYARMVGVEQMPLFVKRM
ncbi:MAG: DinB family protein [Alicyclobacillus sp.]|nr:DinB family protein [Alicyclobacillus sp.]